VKRARKQAASATRAEREQAWRSSLQLAVRQMRGTGRAPGLGYLLERYLEDGDRVALDTGGLLATWMRLAAGHDVDPERVEPVKELLQNAERLVRRASMIAERRLDVPGEKERRTFRVPDAYGKTEAQAMERRQFVLFAEASGKLVRLARDRADVEPDLLEVRWSFAAKELPAGVRARFSHGVMVEQIRQAGEAWNRKPGRPKRKRVFQPTKPTKWEALARIMKNLRMPATPPQTIKKAATQVNSARKAWSHEEQVSSARERRTKK
jgi:hypothetical protein